MNKSGDANRSVRSTKKRLKESLLKLLEEKSVNEISVKELTALADINRGTFYTHYDDIYALLSSIEDGYFNELDMLITGPVETAEEFLTVLTSIFSFFGENKQFFAAICGAHGDISFAERLRKLAESRCKSFWQNYYTDYSPHEFAIYNAFLMSGLIGLMQYWFYGGSTETAQQMAAAACELTTKCFPKKNTAG